MPKKAASKAPAQPATEPQTRAVFRYALDFAGGASPGDESKPELVCTLMIPTGATLMSMKTGATALSIFALVNPKAEPEPRVFRVIRTGEEVPAEAITAWTYVGSLTPPNKTALHIYEMPA